MDALPGMCYILSRIWGSISDFYQRKKPFMVLGFLLGGIALSLTGFSKNVSELLLVILVINFLYAIASPSFYAALGLEKGGMAFGLAQLVGGLGYSIGAYLVGPISANLGNIITYVIASLLTCISSITIMIGYKERERKIWIKEGLGKWIKTSILFKLRARKEFKSLLAAMFISWISGYWVSALLKVKLYLLLEESIVNYGLVMGLGAGLLSTIFSAVAAFAVRRFGGFKLTLLSLLGYGLLIPFLGIISSPIPFILGYVIPIWPFFWTGQMAYTYELSEKGYEAENLGTLTTITSCSSFLALLGGGLTNVVGLNTGITLAGFLYFISVSVLLLPVIYKKSNS